MTAGYQWWLWIFAALNGAPKYINKSNCVYSSIFFERIRELCWIDESRILYNGIKSDIWIFWKVLIVGNFNWTSKLIVKLDSRHICRSFVVFQWRENKRNSWWEKNNWKLFFVIKRSSQAFTFLYRTYVRMLWIDWVSHCRQKETNYGWMQNPLVREMARGDFKDKTRGEVGAIQINTIDSSRSSVIDTRSLIVTLPHIP